VLAHHKRRLTVLFATITLASLSVLAQQPAAKHVRNFGEVNKSIYRGGEPSTVGIEELGAMGVKTVIDLRLRSAATQEEKQQVQKLGMKYISYPLGEFSAPSKTQVEDLLALLAHSDSGTVFIHCRRGKDRTGTIIACYRIQHDHWANQKALAEANQYGMSHLERGMRAFIAHFQALSPNQVAGGQ
jgi:protein tyrosine/serine phosphatase